MFPKRRCRYSELQWPERLPKVFTGLDQNLYKEAQPQFSPRLQLQKPIFHSFVVNTISPRTRRDEDCSQDPPLVENISGHSCSHEILLLQLQVGQHAGSINGHIPIVFNFHIWTSQLTKRHQ